MKNRKVEQLAVVEAVRIKGVPLTTIIASKEKVEMSLLPPGVLLEGNGATLLVPYANVAFAVLEPEVAELGVSPASQVINAIAELTEGQESAAPPQPDAVGRHEQMSQLPHEGVPE